MNKAILHCVLLAVGAAALWKADSDKAVSGVIALVVAYPSLLAAVSKKAIR